MTSKKMSGDSDSSIERAMQGDVSAFASVFEELRPTVFAVACRLVGPLDAEDVVMETYLKAWQALPRFEKRSSIKTWLYRIAHNCSLDMLRARTHRKEEPLPVRPGEAGELAVPDLAQPAPDRQAENAELAGWLDTAISVLSSEHRAVILLRHADGLSYSEIAAATGVSTGTVMSRLFNARRNLKKMFEAEHGKKGRIS
ncbi:MAG: RNA polymerase sigma factor [Lentisphaerales bacterium]|nr:MAG: RNA polymerase sigma factor [Lentisphaerales bacterium]